MQIVRYSAALGLLAVVCSLLGGCRHYIPPPSLDPSSLTVICLGDSITAGTHSDGDSGQLSYPMLLASILNEYRPSVQVVNEGHDGWQVADIASHANAWLTADPPNIILLQIGTNDLEQGAAPAEAAARLDALVTQLQIAAPKSHLYVTSCTKVRKVNRPNLAISTLEQFNNLIPRVVRDHDGRGHFIVFVDLYKRADLSDADIGPDGEHPTNSGYQKIAEYWSWVLQQHETAALHQISTKKGVANEQ